MNQDIRYIPCDKCGWKGKMNEKNAQWSISKYGVSLCWDCIPTEDKLKVFSKYDTASKTGFGKTVD